MPDPVVPTAGDQKPSVPDGGQPSVFDPSKVGDEDFSKVFEDPRIWNHPRFKELNEQAKEAKSLKEKQKVDEEKKLAENKKFEELAQRHAAERDEWKNKYTSSTVDAAIMAEAAKKGITDLDAAKKLIDRTKIVINDDGTVRGVSESVDGLIKDKPYLKGANNRSVGTGSNPPDPDNNTEFTMSQIADPAFYAAHRVEILKAQAQGRIKEDRGF